MYSRIYKSLSALLGVLGSALCAPYSLAQPSKPVAATADIRAGARIPIAYSAPAQGFVSLALYAKSGVLVRSLLYAKPVEKGKHTVLWDGTTDMGKPVAAGAYTAKGIFFTTSPRMNYVMEVGKSGNPPWRTPDGKGDWGGNLGFPSSIVSNNNSLVMTYAAVEDNQITGIQQMDGDGTIQIRYFSFYPWDTRMAAAMDDTNYYLGILNAEKKQIEIAEYKLGEPRGKILTTLPTIPHKDTSQTRWRGRFTAWLDGLAMTKDTLFASIGADNALFVIDRASGQIRKQIYLPSARGLALFGNRLFAVSDGKVIRLTLDGQIEETAVGAEICKSPGALTIDGAGNLYVSDSATVGGFGAIGTGRSGSHQVYVFAPDGKLLRKIGKEGGTPQEGHFDEKGFGTITALCVGPDGKTLWANDIATGFPRTSRWSLDGHLQRQWFGRKLSLFSDVLNSARPNELIYTNDAFADEPGISAYEIDIASKTWRPSWHYDTSWEEMYRSEVVFRGFSHGGNPYNGLRGADTRWPIFDYGSRSFVTYKGKNYFLNGQGVVFRYDGDHKPLPVALAYFHRAQKENGKITGEYDQGPNNWFTWVDKNGDGNLSLEETTFTQNSPLLEKTSRIADARLDENLNIHVSRYITESPGHWHLVNSVLPVKETLPNGAPVYDWSLLQDTVSLQTPDLNGSDGAKRVGGYRIPLPLETSDAYYSMVEPESEQPLTLPGIDGQGWWASRNWRTKVARFDKKTGRCLWAVGRRAPGKALPGQMYHPAWLAGVAGEALFVTDTLGPIWVWNKDGLFLGNMANDFGSGIQNDKTLYGEIQATAIYTDLKTGKIYSVANDTGAHIHEVVLPKLTPLFGATITVTETQIAKAKSWDPDGVAPTEKPAYVVHPVINPIFSPKMDGVMDGREGWDQIADGRPRPEMLILLDGQRVASVRAMYDANNLYLGYSVSAPNGTANSGSELPYAPFVSGAYVDFVLGPNWQGPRTEVREGDLRVILARVKEGSTDKDFQQGFWQIKPAGENARIITSPAAKVHFDQIMAVPGLEMAFKVGEHDPKTGLVSYTAEVAVPLTSLGLSNPAGKSIGFDASVGIANATGDRRERAAHWGGLSEAVVVDRPGSTRLLPDTWGTLRFAPVK